MRVSLAATIARQLVALTLLFFLAPGLSSATADAIHLAIAGHTVDADEDVPHEKQHDERDPCSTEHHCSGAFHICGCASAPAVTVAMNVVSHRGDVAVNETRRALFTERNTSSRDAIEGQFKPPRA